MWALRVFLLAIALTSSHSYAGFLDSIIGYDSYRECVHKETKSCGGTSACKITAQNYCQEEFPPPKKINDRCVFVSTTDQRLFGDSSQRMSDILKGNVTCYYRCKFDVQEKLFFKGTRDEGVCPKTRIFTIQPPR